MIFIYKKFILLFNNMLLYINLEAMLIKVKIKNDHKR